MSPPSLDAVLGHRPELLEGFERFRDAAGDENAADPALLELARARVEQLHDCAPTSRIGADKQAALAGWQSSPLFDARERAILAFAEKMPFAHHAIDDAEAEAARDVLGDGGFVAFTVAIALTDATCRLELTMASA